MKYLFVLLSFSNLLFADFSLLDEAEKNYQQAMTTQARKEKNHFFNLALKQFLQAEDQLMLKNRSLIYQKIGEILYQFREYPLALFYFNQAKNLNSAIPLVYQEKTAEKLGISLNKKKFLFFEKFTLQPYISLINIKDLTYICFILFFISGSLFIWWPFKIYRYLTIFTLIPFLYFSFCFFSFNYLKSIDGFLVTSTFIYEKPTVSSQSRIDLTLPLGLKVEVLKVVKEGNWLKIKTPENIIGYVPKVTLRIIE